MDDSVKVILKKLDDIDSRLKSLERPASDTLRVSEAKTGKIECDPLISKALEIMDKHDELSSKMLAETLKVELKRAETIMDQMEAAGLGTCYMKEE